MSLIPSESFSFPDDFSRAITRARALNEAKTTAALLNARLKRSRARVVAAPVLSEPASTPAPVKLPPPRPVAAKTPPVKTVVAEPLPVVKPPVVKAPPPAAKAAPLPAAKAAPLPAPAPIKIVRKVRHAIEPPTPEAVAEKVAAIKREPRLLGELIGDLQMQMEEHPVRHAIVRTPVARHAPALPLPVQSLPPQPIPVQIVPQALPIKLQPSQPLPVPAPPQPVAEVVESDYEQELWNDPEPRSMVKVYRRKKWKKFMIAEAAALGVLIPTATLALSHYFVSPFMIFLMNILTIAAAFVAGVAPILFFAITPTLPRIER